MALLFVHNLLTSDPTKFIHHSEDAELINIQKKTKVFLTHLKLAIKNGLSHLFDRRTISPQLIRSYMDWVLSDQLLLARHHN